MRNDVIDASINKLIFYQLNDKEWSYVKLDNGKEKLKLKRCFLKFNFFSLHQDFFVKSVQGNNNQTSKEKIYDIKFIRHEEFVTLVKFNW